MWGDFCLFVCMLYCLVCVCVAGCNLSRVNKVTLGVLWTCLEWAGDFSAEKVFCQRRAVAPKPEAFWTVFPHGNRKIKNLL